MANLIIVSGPTGSGKSRSIKRLKPEETYIINCASKDLPFREGRKNYTRDKKNIKNVHNYQKIVRMLQVLPEEKEGLKTVILDDARYIMENEFVDRAAEVGYTKFTQLGQHMIQVLNAAKLCGGEDNKDIDVILMLHTDDVINGTNIVSKKAKLVGQLVENHFDPYELTTIALFTNVETSENGDSKFSFITNRTNIDGVNIPAKSPEGMFPLKIENDLQLVKEKIHEYYYGEENV